VDKKLFGMPLEEKEAYSKEIIREAHKRFGNDIAIAFSGGKDSTTLLHLIRTVFEGRMPWKVFTLDTGAEFGEIKEFVRKLAGEWGFDITVLRNDEIPDVAALHLDKVECCYQRKVIPVNKAVVDYNEQFFSPRESPFYVRVQPVLHFRELDIWSYIKKYSVPYCVLYKKGYRSIDCEPCTKPFGRTGGERGGRDPGKENVMKRLREAGYF
jgi:phosphoadenosine phosphosulfate reductase